MTATVAELRPRPAYVADNGVVRDSTGRALSFELADLLLIEQMREAHEHLEAGRFGAALALVKRADQLLAARVAATEFVLGQSQQPTPPNPAA